MTIKTVVGSFLRTVFDFLNCKLMGEFVTGIYLRVFHWGASSWQARTFNYNLTKLRKPDFFSLFFIQEEFKIIGTKLDWCPFHSKVSQKNYVLKCRTNANGCEPSFGFDNLQHICDKLPSFLFSNKFKYIMDPRLRKLLSNEK